MHSLKIKKKENAEIITLDNFELKNVIEYELKGSANKQTELLVKLKVSTNEIDLK